MQAFVFLRYPDDPDRDTVFGHTPCGPAWLRQLTEDVEPDTYSVRPQEKQETESLYSITRTQTAIGSVKQLVLAAPSFKAALIQAYELLSGQAYINNMDGFWGWVLDNVASVKKTVVVS